MEMNNKIKELTDKIQKEGLEKANQEAERIIGEARSEAEKILSDARAEADKIRKDAEKSARDFQERTESDVRMSQQQALAALKKEITELIQSDILKEPIKSSLDDKKFVAHLLESVVQNWKNSHEDVNLKVLLPPDQLKDVENHFSKKMKDAMANGLVIKEYPGIDRGFEIQPESGNFKISMSDEAFEEFIRDHFRPHTIKFLFGDKK